MPKCVVLCIKGDNPTRDDDPSFDSLRVKLPGSNDLSKGHSVHLHEIHYIAPKTVRLLNSLPMIVPRCSVNVLKFIRAIKGSSKWI